MEQTLLQPQQNASHVHTHSCGDYYHNIYDY